MCTNVYLLCYRRTDKRTHKGNRTMTNSASAMELSRISRGATPRSGSASGVKFLSASLPQQGQYHHHQQQQSQSVDIVTEMYKKPTTHTAVSSDVLGSILEYCTDLQRQVSDLEHKLTLTSKRTGAAASNGMSRR